MAVHVRFNLSRPLQHNQRERTKPLGILENVTDGS